MKLRTILTLGISLVVLSALYSCEEDTAAIVVPEADTITEEENAGLAFMREEEKLARDVYINLFQMYDNKVFDNISQSEDRHMDEVLKLMDQFNIPDPSLPEIGQFTDQDLQKLYDELMALGNDSEVSALLVGATIEDVDIRDLDLFIAKTTNPDIIKVYEFLECGSRNHMRAFVAQLDSLGVTYTPQFITQEQFDGIINGEHEKCGQGYFN